MPDDDGPSFSDFVKDPAAFIRSIVEDVLDDVDYDTGADGDDGDDGHEPAPPAKPTHARRRRQPAPTPEPTPKRRGFFDD